VSGSLRSRHLAPVCSGYWSNFSASLRTGKGKTAEKRANTVAAQFDPPHHGRECGISPGDRAVQIAGLGFFRRRNGHGVGLYKPERS